MISKAYLINEEDFKNIIANSSSCADALRKIGYKSTTGNASVTIRRRIKELGINIDHWADNTKNAHIKNKIPNEEYFVKGKSRNGYGMKKRIIDENLLEYKCSICGNTGEWNGKPLVLQIDHINGDHTDNRLENLRFLCPNCHSQTDTFAGKNVTKSDEEKIKAQQVKKLSQKYCIVCGKSISRSAETNMCFDCYNKTRYTVERPDRKTLAIEIAQTSFVAVGKKYGVSDSSIRKWCTAYKLPNHIKKLREYVKEQGWLN